MSKTLATALLISLSPLLGSIARAQSADVVSQAGFGASVTVVGSDVLVGESLNMRYSGRVYVYRRSETSGKWANVQVLEPSDGTPMNGFGDLLAASGDLAAITAVEMKRREIHLFRRGADSSWNEEAILTPDAEESDDASGLMVAVAGERVFATVVGIDGSARVVIYEPTGPDGGWGKVDEVVLPAMNMTSLPLPVVASDDVAFVGGPGLEGGSVFVLRKIEDHWNVSKVIQNVSGDGDDTSLFGSSLALDAGRLLVGAPQAEDGAGEVFVFAANGADEFDLVQRLKSFGDNVMPAFGSVVSARDGTAFVGAYNPQAEAGMAYVFKADASGRYQTVQAIAGETMEDRSDFGTTLAMDGDFAVVGAKKDLFEYGSASIYEKSGEQDHWRLAAHLRSELTYRIPSVTGRKTSCEDGSAGQFPCRNVDLMSFLSNKDLGLGWGIQTNDVWGWTDPESGKEYAIVCTMEGTTFVDVSDPLNPVVLGELPMTPGTRPNWWRDAKTYKNYAYIVADNVGNHGLQIFDLTQLRGVENPPVKFEPTALYDGFGSAHNIVIDEETGFAYVVGIRDRGKTCGGGFHILDLSDPQNPKFVGCFAHEGTGEMGTGYTHDAQCVIYRGPDERYAGREICIASNETAISISDVTDKSNIIPIAVGRYPTSSYVHQGWLSNDQRYFFEDDEADEINGLTPGTRTLVWDLVELDDPVLVDEHVSTNRATDHNLYVKGSFMYESNYLSGLRVFDVADPLHIREVGYLDTVPWGDDRPGYGGSWSNYPFFKSGEIVVTSSEEGVFFVRPAEVAP